MTPEGKVKAAVKELLVEYGAYFFMPVQTGYGASSLDFLCSIKGRFVAVETKAPGSLSNVTPRQTKTLAAVRESGALAYVTDNADALRRWLERDIGAP